MGGKATIINPAEVIEYLNRPGISRYATCLHFNIAKTTLQKVIDGTWKPPGETTREKVQRMQANGIGFEEIADKLGIHIKTAYMYSSKKQKRKQDRYGGRRKKDYGIPEIKSGPCKRCGREKGANRYWCAACHHEISNYIGDCPESDGQYGVGYGGHGSVNWSSIK